jgi:hypothetical protein
MSAESVDEIDGGAAHTPRGLNRIIVKSIQSRPIVRGTSPACYLS